MSRVLIIGSSAALPRPGTPYQQTWPSLLQDARPDLRFIAISRRRNNSRSLTSLPTPPEWSYGDNLLFYTPDCVIIQVGMSECMPRYMRDNLFHKLLDRMPSWVQTAFWRPYKLVFKRSLKRTDVPLDEFRRNVDSHLDQCIKAGVKKVIIILIHTPPQWMLRRMPTLAEGVRLYNEAFEEIAARYNSIATCINPINNGRDELYLKNDFHFSATGHELVARAILEQLPNDNE